MNESILEEIQRTNEILIRLSIVILIGVFFWSLRSVTVIWSQLRKIRQTMWRDSAWRLWDQDKMEELRAECIEKIQREPKNPDGYYWKALSERELKMEQDLRGTLTRVLQLRPDWKEDWMIPFISEQEAGPNLKDRD